MSWILNKPCDLCSATSVMAYMGRAKSILCRMCEACYTNKGGRMSARYEVWRGDYLESLADDSIGDATKEYLVKMDIS